MANDLNCCSFIGRLGNEPETKAMPNGDMVTNISIAVGESWKDKNGQKQEATEWVRVVAFRKLAEIIGQYLGKGDLVYISGKMKTRKWQDQSGNDRYSTEIVANNMQMLGGKKDNQQQETVARQQPQHTQQGFQAPQDAGVKPHIPEFEDNGQIPF
jgi:single-strand DNA-binding protein